MKFDFLNNEGQLLSGSLEKPDSEMKAIAIFSHCFTCSKNVKAAASISRALSSRGIGVLRFDFTGLGNSEGDFANTNFSSNVADLLSAFNALKSQFQAPQILIGHSLGGAAVLKAAALLEEIRAVVTIGAPSSVDHVSHLFINHLDDIKNMERVEIDLFGRKFTITSQFIKDINETEILGGVTKFRKALLVLHSPTDNIVSIEHAANIFKAAKHPKSFISLDNADHLISDKKDSDYIGEIVSSWATRYVNRVTENISPTIAPGHVLVRSIIGEKFKNNVNSDKHHLTMDEPITVGGTDSGMTPYQFLAAALGGCTSMTVKMYAERKGIPLEKVQVDVFHEKVQQNETKVDRLTKEIRLFGEKLTPEQKLSLYEIAEKCPVNRTLKSEITIESRHG